MENELQTVELTGSQKYNAYRAAWKKDRYNSDPAFRQRRLELDKATRDRKAARAPPKEPRPPSMTKT